MRIDLNAGVAIPDNQLEKNPAPRPARAADTNHESRFSVSETSVSALATAALSAPEARLEKVAQLRSQILAGTYRASPDQVAGAVLEQMRVHQSEG